MTQEIIVENNIEVSTQERELGAKPIGKLFTKYCIPAILASLIPCTQVILDGIFLGGGVGAEALAAIGILFPYFTLITAISNLIGNGGASICTIELGKGNVERARKILALSIGYSLVLTILISILSFAFLPQVIGALGGRGEIAELIGQYMRVYLISFPFMTTGYTIYYFVRADEQPLLGTLFMFVPPVLAIFIEHYLIYSMGVGVASSAIACSITLGPSFFLILYFLVGKTQLKLKFSDFRPSLKEIGAINKVGFSSFSIQITTMIVTIIVNNMLVSMGAGAYEIGAYGIINAYLYYVLAILSYSFGVGIQPMISYNFGTRAYGRVKSSLLCGCGFGFGIMTLVIAACYILIGPLTNVFCAGDAAFFEVTKGVIMKYLFGLSCGTIALVGSYYYQAIESAGKATFLAMSRTFIFLLPLLFLMPKVLGMDGIWFAFPIAEILAGAVTIIMLRKDTKKLTLENTGGNHA